MKQSAKYFVRTVVVFTRTKAVVTRCEDWCQCIFYGFNILFWGKIYCYKEDTLFVYLVLPVLAWIRRINFRYKKKTFLGIVFWASIAVNRYLIEPGYVPVNLHTYTQKITVKYSLILSELWGRKKIRKRTYFHSHK